MASDDGRSMTFWEHLEELRRRIIISAIAVGISVAASLTFHNFYAKILTLPLNMPINASLATLIDWVGAPEASFFGFLSIVLRASGSTVDAEIIKGGVVEGIMAYIKISFTFGFLMASPVVLYQIWSFIFPALTHREKRYALPLFFVIVFFFVVGAIFAYFIVAPVVIEFSAKLLKDYANLWELDRYVNFLTRLLIGFGIAFELPIVMAFLSWIGVINSQGFRERRHYAFLGIFVLSAMLTPADPASMLLMAIPLIGLYQLGIFLAFLVESEPETYA